MSVIGNCIKTGAVCQFEEYGQVIVADLFAVENAVIVRFAPNIFNTEHAFNTSRKVTHTVFVGNGLLDKRNGYAVVSVNNIKETAL